MAPWEERVALLSQVGGEGGGKCGKPERSHRPGEKAVLGPMSPPPAERKGGEKGREIEACSSTKKKPSLPRHRFLDVLQKKKERGPSGIAREMGDVTF